ncbi:MAG: hypothetical protein KDK91_02850 [Gammaproteobacteria bacterium]|nr:hypothetical protein [Gammaproteobacteria bacterium]
MRAFAFCCLLVSATAQASMVIDDFNGPDFSLCVNAVGCESELDVLVDQVAGAWGLRDSRIGITARTDPQGDPDLPGSFSVSGGVAQVHVDSLGMSVDPADDFNKVDLAYNIPLPNQDVTASGDRFLIDLTQSNLGARTATLTLDISGPSGQGGQASVLISTAGTYSVLFADFVGTVPEFALLDLRGLLLIVDLQDAIGNEAIDLTFDNFRVGTVPLPASIWLLAVALGATLRLAARGRR